MVRIATSILGPLLPRSARRLPFPPLDRSPLPRSRPPPSPQPTRLLPPARDGRRRSARRCRPRRPAAGRPSGLKRRRVAVGSAEQYEEINRLGEGAFGAVVKARHRGTGRLVAIKRLGATQCGAEELLREARFLEDACGGGDNPFVVGFHGVVRVPGTLDLRLVMECVGPCLDDLLRQSHGESPPLPEATVRAAMWQLLTGAKKMHERRVTHRDIKPSNILVGPGCSVLKICDFGLAMSMDEPPPYESAGTLCYMAPEMLLDKPDYDERVDTWSLGCIMAELINGWNPFQGLNEEGQLCAIFDMLGVPDDTTWPWFSSTKFATVLLPDLDMQRHNVLRKHFPKTKLSKDGFEVLSGLLTCNPEKRLTAAAALKLRWFAKIDALELPKKEEAVLPLPKRLKPRFVCVS